MKKLSTLLILSLLVAMLPLAASAGELVDLTKVQPAPDGAAAWGPDVPAGGTLAVLDDFNRADGPIGANWTVHDGYCNVSNNAAVCGDMARATFNGAPGDGNFAEADIADNGTALQYTGLLLNYGAGNSNLFLKVQNQSGGNQFGNAACYTGNNGAGFGLGFFALSSPFSTAHMSATRVGNDVTIEFTNVDGGAQPDQTYVCSGAPAPEGTGIGIVGYVGIARLDNFGGPGGGGGDPDIEVTPTSLFSEQCQDTVTTQTLTICNVGGEDLTWEISEEPVSGLLSTAGGAAPRPPAPGATGSRGGSAGAAQPIQNTSLASFSEGFDDITLLPGQGWFFQNNSSPLGLTDWFQGNDTVFPAHAGASTAYIGANFNNTSGIGTISNWMLTPEISLNNGDAISFWTRVPDRQHVA